MNADDSSELVLASLLSGGNGFISRGWVYSSELRVLNTQWIRALLFRFTDSWTAVRVVGNLALDGWLLGAYRFFMGQLTEKKNWFWYTAPFLLLPFSHEAFYVTVSYTHLDVYKRQIVLPVAAYSVSGEYAMIKAGASLGYIDEASIICETAASAYRAGVDLYLTYFAKEIAGFMDEGRIG